MARINLDVNGKVQTIDADPDMPLLYALRNDLGLNNPHFGCGLAQCGACTVHVDGQAVRSCVTPVSAVGNGKVVTLAGLGTPEKPHPIQKAYVEEQVPQCGYCINGWIMTAASLLNQNKKPNDAQIKDALTGSTQERTALPSTCTVQAPHCATPHPYFVPVRPTCSRITQSSGVVGSTSILCDCPLMVSATMCPPAHPPVSISRRQLARGVLCWQDFLQARVAE